MEDTIAIEQLIAALDVHLTDEHVLDAARECKYTDDVFSRAMVIDRD